MVVYEGNSHKERDEKANQEAKKKIEKVVSGPVRVKKKSGFARFMGNFISDNLPDVANRIVSDIVVPAIKKGITQSIDILLNGSITTTRTNASKVSYRSYYDEPRAREAAPARSSFNYDDIVFDSYGEADLVLSTLDDAIREYGMVSVADLYDAVNLSCDYTANKYGWRNLRNAEVVRSRDGWTLKMPRPTPL